MAKTLGLALGAGMARGWAHIGVLRALEEMGLKPDVITGSSVGAMVGGAYLVGAIEELETWAYSLSPLSALRSFNLQITRGGFVNAESAFEAFAEFDRDIESLDCKYGAIACDLATGEPVEIISGSIIQAARASSAVPVLFQSVAHQGRWLVDGAIADPTPIELARKLGADIVIGVDLMAIPGTLERFDSSKKLVNASNLEPSIDEKNISENEEPHSSLSVAIERLINETKIGVEKQIIKAKEKVKSKPQVFETGMAVANIMQMHISRSRALRFPADIMLTPDMREASPTSFDRSEEFIETGRASLMAYSKEIEALMAS